MLLHRSVTGIAFLEEVGGLQRQDYVVLICSEHCAWCGKNSVSLSSHYGESQCQWCIFYLLDY